MAKDRISGRLMQKILHAFCNWVVSRGLYVLQSYMDRVCINSVESVAFIVSLLTESMLDTAATLLASQGVEMSSKLRDALEGRCRQILGSIEQHVQRQNLNKEQALKFSAAWRRLQATKKAISEQARRAEKDRLRRPSEQVNHSV